MATPRRRLPTTRLDFFFHEIGLDLLERSLGFVSCVLRLDLGGFYDFSVCVWGIRLGLNATQRSGRVFFRVIKSDYPFSFLF
ncbi:Os07g0267300, partial [Oryza sativa Japonica Group]